MNLYFQNYKGTDKLIASDIKNHDEALRAIKRFCNERDFRIRYYRSWTENNETMFDVGSHSEFFKLKN